MPRPPSIVLVSAALVALLAGCSVQKVGQVGAGPREAITFAAQARYPGGATTRSASDVRAVALYDNDRKALDVYNIGTQAIPATALWVNGRFVAKLSNISPRSHTTVKYEELIEAGAGINDFAKMQTTPAQVEIQTRDGLHPVLGAVPR
jgi:hypothetical protein